MTTKSVKLICKINGSNKFWNARSNNYDIVIEYGRIGSAGTTQLKKFLTKLEASNFFDKKVSEKLKKGYVHLNKIKNKKVFKYKIQCQIKNLKNNSVETYSQLVSVPPTDHDVNYYMERLVGPTYWSKIYSHANKVTTKVTRVQVNDNE